MRGWHPRVCIVEGVPILAYQQPFGDAVIHAVGQTAVQLGPGFTPQPIGWGRWLYLGKNNSLWKVTLRNGTFSQVQLPVAPGLVNGNKFRAGGNRWANVVAGTGRLVVDGRVLKPNGCQAAVDVGHRFVACPVGPNGEHVLRIRLTDGVEEFFPIQTPLFELTIRDGWIVYGGGANSRLLTIGPTAKPGDKHQDVTVAPWKAEGGDAVACKAARRIWIWSSTGRGQIAGRPMGSKTAILFPFWADMVDAAFDEGVFHVVASGKVQLSSATGQLFYETVRRNAPRKLVT